MILNRAAGAIEWNKSVNSINIQMGERYREISKNVSLIESSVAQIRASDSELHRKLTILENKLEFLKLFVEAYNGGV